MTGSSAKILADHNTLLSSPQPPHQDFYRCIGTRFPVTSRWLLTRSNAIHRTRLTLEIHSAALLSKPYLRCHRILQQQPSYNSTEELIAGRNRGCFHSPEINSYRSIARFNCETIATMLPPTIGNSLDAKKVLPDGQTAQIRQSTWSAEQGE